MPDLFARYSFLFLLAPLWKPTAVTESNGSIVAFNDENII